MSVSDPLGLLGETLADKYLVESLVGAGGFATVYRARHLLWNRPVAVKVFNFLGTVEGGKQQELVDAFLREGAILAELSERSPAICQARDAGSVTTRAGATLPYLILEWLDGSTLADILAVESGQGRTPRTAEDAVRLLSPIAHALALAHQCGIVHRDVKPANIFVLRDPTEQRFSLKLLDFGVAKVRSSPEAMSSTAGSFAAFTPSFAAPEQFSRKYGATGPWTDVYALALVLVEVITGREAQGGDDIAAIAAVAFDRETRPTPRARGTEVGDEVEAVFRRAVAVSPGERYPDLASLWEALHGVLALGPFDAPLRPSAAQSARVVVPIHDNPTQDLPPVEPVDVPRTGGRRPLRWGLTLAVGATLIAAAGGLWSARSSGLTRATPRQEPRTAEPVPSVPSALSAPSAPSAPAAATSREEEHCPDEMASIPGGSFFMGDDEGTKPERPAHQVHLPPYCMDRFEVTVAAYKACSDRGECKRALLTNAWSDIDAHQRSTFDPLCNARDPEGRAQHPINCVDWEMASHFCESHGKRLPTEAEWEFAARGPDGRRYPWGDDPPSASLLNACGTECEAWGRKHGEDESAMYRANDGFATTAPVGSFPRGASRYGLQDVVGNVWEWVDDWYAPYTADSKPDPAGPRSGTERVIRGGAWNGREPSWVRPTFRFKASPTDRSYGTGFRCAR